MLFQYFVDSTCETDFGHFDLQGQNRGGQIPLKDCSPPPWKNVLAIVKKLGLSQKTLRPTWCPKLVTGLLTSWRKLHIAQSVINYCQKDLFSFLCHAYKSVSLLYFDTLLDRIQIFDLNQNRIWIGYGHRVFENRIKSDSKRPLSDHLS